MPNTHSPTVAAEAPSAIRKRGRPRDAGADARILQAAGALMLERGFDNMTVDAVAAAAKAGKATVYRRWSSKEDLARAALEQMYSQEVPIPDTGSVRTDIRTLLADLLEFAGSESGRAYIRMTFSEALRDPRVAELHAEATRLREGEIRAMLQRGLDRGELRADVDLEWPVRLFGSIVTYGVPTGRTPIAVGQADAIVDFMMRGIGA